MGIWFSIFLSKVLKTIKNMCKNRIKFQHDFKLENIINYQTKYILKLKFKNIINYKSKAWVIHSSSFNMVIS